MSHAIVSSRYAVHIVDVDNLRIVERLRTGDYDTLYYGITWNEDFMFIAKRHLCCRTQIIEVFDLELNYLKSFHVSSLDTHQIYWHAGKLYVMNSGNNAVTIVNGNGEFQEIWYPNPSVQGRDINHFNSIFTWGNLFLLIAHNKGASQLWVFNEHRDLINKFPVGNGSHNIGRFHEDYIVLDSKHGKIMRPYADAIDLPYNKYPRGLAISIDKVMIGRSEHNTNREERHIERKGAVQVYSEGLVTCDEIELNSGQVFEVRYLGGTDYAHNRIIWRGKYGS